MCQQELQRFAIAMGSVVHPQDWPFSNALEIDRISVEIVITDQP